MTEDDDTQHTANPFPARFLDPLSTPSGIDPVNEGRVLIDGRHGRTQALEAEYDRLIETLDQLTPAQAATD